MSGAAIFITGTDTGVGKTVITALLASILGRRGLGACPNNGSRRVSSAGRRDRAQYSDRRLDVGIMKPVASGAVFSRGRLLSPDVVFCAERLGLKDPPDLINPVCFLAPLAPAIAGKKEGKNDIDLSRLDSAYESLKNRHDFLLVEGVGGLLVPLDARLTVAGLAKRWGIPILVVARPGLGTINHTALTISAAKESGIETAGFLFNASREGDVGPDWEESAAWIEQSYGIPFWGMVPFMGGVANGPRQWRACVNAIEPALMPHLQRFLLATATEGSGFEGNRSSLQHPNGKEKDEP